MNKRVMFDKKTGAPVQVIAQAKTQPNYQDVICYQELTSPFEYYVMERREFSATYTRGFDEIEVKDEPGRIDKRRDLPDKRAMRRERKKEKNDRAGSPDAIEMEGPIGMGGSIGMSGPVDEMTERMMDFFDARTFSDRIQIFEDMKEADNHILTNIAVSMDIPLEDDADNETNYNRIMSELQLRKKFEASERRDSLKLQ